MKISDLGTIITGKTPSTKKKVYWNGEIPFITPRDLQNSKHIFTTARTITEDVNFQ
jgi:type I restriction enzyme S subunit